MATEPQAPPTDATAAYAAEREQFWAWQLARAIHRMYHEDRPLAYAIEYTARECASQGGRSFDELGRLKRKAMRAAARGLVMQAWGAKHCGPDHNFVVCEHEPPS